MSDSTPLIIANWKSHKSRDGAVEWMDTYETWVIQQGLTGVKVVLAPAFPALMFLANRLLKPELKGTYLGVQDLSPFPAGAYTGAVSTQNLEGLNVRYAIIGHSERRRYFHETNQAVANKVDLAVQAGITPVVCVDAEYVHTQAAAIGTELTKHCIVAYEPLEAIGTGHNQPVAEVEPVVKEISVAFGAVPVLYGGSVTAANISEYLRVCQGALVGGASLKAADFTALLAASRASA